SMTGDARVRFCSQCDLHVYNLAELTRKEAEALVTATEGRICGRIYRRADGTVITKDCPVGLRAIRRRVARRTAAVFAAIASLCATAMADARSLHDVSRGSAGRFSRANALASAELSGRVTDPTGEPIKGARVTLTNVQTNQKHSARADKDGRYH